MNNKKFNIIGKVRTAAIVSALMLPGGSAIADVLNPVLGEILYEEHFNTLDPSIWTTDIGDGCDIDLCWWGNNELQYYTANNIKIVNPPFEPYTTALAIEARREPPPKGKLEFTSGRVTTKNKLQIQYGMIEVRMSAPKVGVGLWPAAWMLGTSLSKWPANGEFDIMEMGHKKDGQAMAGHAGADLNSYVGSNVIFYHPAACSENNKTCAASTAWQTDNAYVAHTPLVNRFVIYRLYWTDTQLRFTIIDNGLETDLYNAPIVINEEATELQAPFYLLFNLAVGGDFTDAKYAYDVTAPLPGAMYVDYVRIRKLNGMGEVKISTPPPAEIGTYGVFTDSNVVTKKQETGVTSDIWTWNQTSMSAGSIPAYEGSSVIAWKYTAPQWFGGNIVSRNARNMRNFKDGNLKFRIKIPANVSFKIGIADTAKKENWVNFPANATTYGLVRNGEWAQATIPVSALTGDVVSLDAMSALFSIASMDGALPTNNFEMAVDDVIWECGSSPACQGISSSSSSSRGSSSVTSSSSSSLSSTICSSSSSVSGSLGHTILSGSSVKFYVNAAHWADVHYTVNGGVQQNIRMIHNADNSNIHIVTGIAPGAVVKYFYTIGQSAGAVDTPWMQFSM